MKTIKQLWHAKKAVVNASNKVAEGVADFKDQEFVGGSYNKNLQELNNALRKEGKEITLEDVYDEGIKLLDMTQENLIKTLMQTEDKLSL